MKKQNLRMAVIIIALTFGQITYAQDMQHDNMQQTPLASPMSSQNTTTGTNQNISMSNAEILSIVAAVDSDEINAAIHAEKKNLHKSVRDYAKMMRKEHNLNLQMTKKLEKSMGLKNVQTPMVIKIHSENAAQLAPLLKLNGTQFEKGYMDMMVNSHQKTLTMLDTQLIPSATDARVRQHLTMTRTSVAMHLSMAKNIRNALPS